MNRHALWMLIGCVLPVLLIFLLPAFGVSNNVTLVVFVALMFACHFFMPGHHHHGGNDNSSRAGVSGETWPGCEVTSRMPK